jgi:hypothetical protein
MSSNLGLSTPGSSPSKGVAPAIWQKEFKTCQEGVSFGFGSGNEAVGTSLFLKLKDPSIFGSTTSDFEIQIGKKCQYMTVTGLGSDGRTLKQLSSFHLTDGVSDARKNVSFQDTDMFLWKVEGFLSENASTLGEQPLAVYYLNPEDYLGASVSTPPALTSNSAAAVVGAPVLLRRIASSPGASSSATSGIVSKGSAFNFSMTLHPGLGLASVTSEMLFKQWYDFLKVTLALPDGDDFPTTGGPSIVEIKTAHQVQFDELRQLVHGLTNLAQLRLPLLKKFHEGFGNLVFALEKSKVTKGFFSLVKGLEHFFSMAFIKSVRDKMVPASVSLASWGSSSHILRTTHLDDDDYWSAMLLHVAQQEAHRGGVDSKATKHNYYAKLRELVVKFQKNDSVLSYVERIHQRILSLYEEHMREEVDWGLFCEMHLLAGTNSTLFCYFVMGLYSITDFSAGNSSKLEFGKTHNEAEAFWGWLRQQAINLDSLLRQFTLDPAKYSVAGMEGPIAVWSLAFRKRYMELHNIASGAGDEDSGKVGGSSTKAKGSSPSSEPKGGKPKDQKSNKGKPKGSEEAPSGVSKSFKCGNCGKPTCDGNLSCICSFCGRPFVQHGEPGNVEHSTACWKGNLNGKCEKRSREGRGPKSGGSASTAPPSSTQRDGTSAVSSSSQKRKAESQPVAVPAEGATAPVSKKSKATPSSTSGLEKSVTAKDTKGDQGATLSKRGKVSRMFRLEGSKIATKVTNYLVDLLEHRSFKATELGDGSILIHRRVDASALPNAVWVKDAKVNELGKYFDGSRVTDKNCVKGYVGSMLEVHFLLDTMCDFNLISRNLLQEYLTKLDPVKNVAEIEKATLKDLPIPLKVELADDTLTQFNQYVFLRVSFLLQNGKRRKDFGNKYVLFFVGNSSNSRNVILGAPFLEAELNFTFEGFLDRRSSSMDIEGSKGDDSELLAKSAALLSLEEQTMVKDMADVKQLPMVPVSIPKAMLVKEVTQRDECDSDNTDYGEELHWLQPARKRPLEPSCSLEDPSSAASVFSRLGPKVGTSTKSILERLGVKQAVVNSTVSDPPRKVFFSKEREVGDAITGVQDSVSRVVELDSDGYDDMLCDGHHSA